MMKKPKKETYCHYERQWIPLGKHRTRCPKCGAELDLKNPDALTLGVREIAAETAPPKKDVR